MEMNSQLADDGITEESQKSVVMEEACHQGGERVEEQQPATEEKEEEMSQDERETKSDDTAAPSDKKAGGEEKGMTAGEGEQQLSVEGEGEMSQDEGDMQTMQHKDTVPAVVLGDNQAGDEWGKQGENVEAAGAAKLEEMASQGSSSDTDSDSEPSGFPRTLEGFGYHFKDGV